MAEFDFNTPEEWVEEWRATYEKLREHPDGYISLARQRAEGKLTRDQHAEALKEHARKGDEFEQRYHRLWAWAETKGWARKASRLPWTLA